MKLSNFSQTTSRLHTITGIISVPNKGCYATLRQKKKKSQVLKVTTSDLSPTFPSIFSYTSYQLLPSQFKKQYKREAEDILLWYQYLDNT